MFRTFLRRSPHTGHFTSERISGVSRHRISRFTRPDSIARTRSRGSPTRYFSSPFMSFSTSAFKRRWLSTIGRVLKIRCRDSRTRASFGIRQEGIGRETAAPLVRFPRYGPFRAQREERTPPRKARDDDRHPTQPTNES